MQLLFVEKWSDQAALLQHFKVPESRTFARQIAGFSVRAPSMVVYSATPIEL
jgi:quinol monooxygenase YgiN